MWKMNDCSLYKSCLSYVGIYFFNKNDFILLVLCINAKAQLLELHVTMRCVLLNNRCQHYFTWQK